jgi:hypothetical protein
MSDHKDLTPENTPNLLPADPRVKSPADIAEEKAAANDPVFDALIRKARRKERRWILKDW